MTQRRGTVAAWRALLGSVALGLVASIAPGVAAGPGQQLGFAPKVEQSRGPLSLDQAVAKVRKRHPKAEIVGAETRDAERGPVHVVKALRQNGKVQVYRFDATTGVELD